MEKAQEAQKEMRAKLEGIHLTGDAESGMVRITMSGNRKLLDIHIDNELIIRGDKQAIEELLTTAFQRALDKADALHAEEMKNTAKGILPNIPGLF